MRTPTILVVEDEPTIAAALAARLRKEGFGVEVAPDGPSAVDASRRLRPDLAVVDVMLPGFDGFEVVRRMQRERPVPVLILTARDSETDLLLGLGIGADDYMTKPFSPRELVARVQAILRRATRPPAATDVVRVGALEIDPVLRAVRSPEGRVHLTATEFDLLHLMASRPGAVHTREQLLAEVWGYRDGYGGRTVDSHVRALRKKLGADIIRTVHGVGYAVRDQG